MAASPVGTVGQGRGQGAPRAVQTWAWRLTGTRTGGEGQHHLKKHDIGEKQLLSQLLKRKQSVKNRQRIFLHKRSPDFIPAEQRRDEASHTEGCARSTPGWGDAQGACKEAMHKWSRLEGPTGCGRAHSRLPWEALCEPLDLWLLSVPQGERGAGARGRREPGDSRSGRGAEGRGCRGPRAGSAAAPHPCPARPGTRPPPCGRGGRSRPRRSAPPRAAAESW